MEPARITLEHPDPIMSGWIKIVRWLTLDDVAFIYPQRGGNYIHGRGMQGRWLRALYARIEPYGA